MKRIFVVLVFLLFCPSASIALEASVAIDGYSFSLGPASTSNGESITFTTYDGTDLLPLLECAAFCFGSEEVSPNGLGSTQYLTDYLVVDAIGVYEFGTAVFDAVASDSDGDGMLDPLELPNNGGFSFSGLTYPDWNAFGIYVNSAVVGSIIRPPGVRQGTYSGSLSNPSQTASFGGILALSGAYGTVEYFVDVDPTLYWNLTQRAIDGTIRTFTAASSVSAIGTDTLVIPSFLAFDSQSLAFLQTLPATLTRSGNTFRGTVRLVDGDLTTAWADYLDFRIEIVDDNDTNGDGLPDIIYAPEPSFAAQLIASVLGLAFLGRRRAIRSSVHFS